MNRAILLVGPSGAGKTSASLSIESQSDRYSALSLDSLAAEYWSRKGLISLGDFQLLAQSLWPAMRLLAAGLEALRDYAAGHNGKSLIVELAPTFQDVPSASDLWRTFEVVAITAAPEVAYRRYSGRTDDRLSAEEYIRREFNVDRMRVYSSAQHQIDSTAKTMGQTAEELAAVLRTIAASTSESRDQVGWNPSWFAEL